MGVVVITDKLCGIDILVEGAVEIDFDGDIRGKVELRVEGASAVAALDACGSRKLPYVGSTGGWAVQALLDAVAFILDQRKSQVDLSHNTGHVKALDIWKLLAQEQDFRDFWRSRTYIGCTRHCQHPGCGRCASASRRCQIGRCYRYHNYHHNLGQGWDQQERWMQGGQQKGKLQKYAF